jgi:hypothetical protein
MAHIDTDTNRPVGDHGTASNAIEFALHHHDDTLQTYEFLAAWQRGDLSEWPEYHEWLNKAHPWGE